jgi:CheY-like chemotaxis protein/pimeloyl-ACP methyl ester carboxylesterase
VESLLTELILISSAENPRIDVIFVHGLDGNAKDTWDFGNQPSWDTWIQNVHPAARIWSLSYRLHSSRWHGGSMAIQDRAVNVLATISGDISGETPVLFVCHSYGGLLIKQMLSTGLGRAHNEYGRLADRVKAIVFLGTPHNGSRIADYVDALKFVLRSSAAIAELKQNSPHLRELGGWFRNHAKSAGWKMRVFFETINTRGVRIVDEESADPHIPNVTPIGIDADHFEICKPPRPDVRLTQTNVLVKEILMAAELPGSSVRVVDAYAELPCLRRYARALAGSQQVGDSFVGAVFELLLQEVRPLTKESLRIVLYTMFTKLWNALSQGVRSPDLPKTSKLARITPVPRQAFLLTAMEGFTEEEVAEIMCVDEQRVRALVAEAGRELAQDRALKILIIEDEKFLALDIESIVKSLGHTVTGMARTHTEATELWRRTRADLILSDVQLADGSSGLDAVNEVYREAAVPVIFITAYPERFLTGERPEPAFLMSKPFQPAAVAAAISQVLFLGDQAIEEYWKP